jgi:transposase
VVSHPGYDRRIPKLTSKKNLRAAMTLLRGDRSSRAELIRDRVADIRKLGNKIAGVEKQMATKVSESGTTLTQLRGVGFIVAAKILGEVGDPSRLRSKGSFAMLTGTAPLEASSGRPNVTGSTEEARFNYALHMMALARCCGDADTRTYMARLHTDGKSHKESLRCLKRQLFQRHLPRPHG